MPNSIVLDPMLGSSWPFHAVLASRSDSRFSVATLDWAQPDATARSTLLTADTVSEAAQMLVCFTRSLRGRPVHGPLGGLDPTNLLTAWTSVPMPPELRDARRFKNLLAGGPPERRIAAADELQHQKGTTMRFAVEGLAKLLATLIGVEPPAFRRERAHGVTAYRRHHGCCR